MAWGFRRIRSSVLADDSLKEFRDRLKRIEKKSKKGNQRWLSGSETMAADGSAPKKRGIWVPWKFLFMVAGGFVAFKVFLLINLGENTYHQKLSVVDDGTLMGEVGIRLMDLDPVTIRMRDYVVPIVDNIFIN